MTGMLYCRRYMRPCYSSISTRTSQLGAMMRSFTTKSEGELEETPENSKQDTVLEAAPEPNTSTSAQESSVSAAASEATSETNSSEKAPSENAQDKNFIEFSSLIKNKGGDKKPQIDAQSDLAIEREPVEVHDLEYPIRDDTWYRIIPESLKYSQMGNSHIMRVPKLAHGLERVLFSPGVHRMQDPHSKVYNFDPYIERITQPDEFDYDKLTPYITSSKDKALMSYARSAKKKFVGSTSSMTHVLSHLYFIVSAWKQPSLLSLSMRFAKMQGGFTRGLRYPASINLRYHDGVYGIDADKSFDVSDSILSVLGKSMEKLLTSPPKEFNMYKKKNSWQVKEIAEENYHYVCADEFVLRSQLDCRDDRLPRRTFDLKTRGALAVRMDIQNYEISSGYQIKTMKGRVESFEREYYDMIRSSLLKYNFQTRIGNMDGIFVAYHNTVKMFGFQYFNREDMDHILFGNEPTGTKAFKTVIILLGKILRTITDQFSNQDLRVTFDSANGHNSIDIWVEVVNDDAEAEAMKKQEERLSARAAADSAKGAEDGSDSLSSADTEAPPTESTESDPFSDKLGMDSGTGPDLLENLYETDEDIYINSDEKIIKYTLETFSTINGKDTDESVTVRSKEDEWAINWKLTKSTLDQPTINNLYKGIRIKQSTYFDRPDPDTPDDQLKPFMRILRNISRRNLWRNKKTNDRVVVNRSRRPISPDEKPLFVSRKMYENPTSTSYEVDKQTRTDGSKEVRRGAKRPKKMQKHKSRAHAEGVKKPQTQTRIVKQTKRPGKLSALISRDLDTTPDKGNNAKHD